jgi:hypothetical protein
MVGACSTYVGEVRKRFWWGNLRAGDHFGMQGVEWIDMAQDSGKRRTLVNAVMDLRVLYKAGNFLTS